MIIAPRRRQGRPSPPASGRARSRRPARADEAERRLLRIITWMKARSDPFTRDDLVEAFPRDYAGKPDAVEKKFLRDKAAIERLGIALRPDEGETTSYLVDRTALHLARVQFERGEAAAVWMAGRAAARAADHPLAAELASALRKLVVGTGGLPPTVPGPGALAPPPEGRPLVGWLELLADAVQRRRRLHLVYRGGQGAETVRDVDVYGYGLRDGEWFFVGHCHLRGARRIFFLRRAVSLKAGRGAGHDCVVPKDAKGGDFEVPRDFDFDQWKTQRPWDYLAHPPVEAVVRLGGALAPAARRLLPRAEVTSLPDGRRLARLVVRNLDGLVRQVLAWGPSAELVAPPEGRARARAILTEAAAAHGPGVTG
jgi:predicted DNA-binding transcriptional regulator YafY